MVRNTRSGDIESDTVVLLQNKHEIKLSHLSDITRVGTDFLIWNLQAMKFCKPLMKKYVLGWVSRKIADANLVGHNSRPMKINHSCNEILDWKFVILRKLLKLSWRTLTNIFYTYSNYSDVHTNCGSIYALWKFYFTAKYALHPSSHCTIMY